MRLNPDLVYKYSKKYQSLMPFTAIKSFGSGIIPLSWYGDKEMIDKALTDINVSDTL